MHSTFDKSYIFNKRKQQFKKMISKKIKKLNLKIKTKMIKNFFQNF